MGVYDSIFVIGSYGMLAKADLSDYLMIGELSLDGKLRAVRGALSIAMLARDRKIPHLLVALRREGITAPIGIITYGYDEPAWDGKLPGGTRFVLRHLLHWPWTRFDVLR